MLCNGSNYIVTNITVMNYFLCFSVVKTTLDDNLP